MKILIVSGLSWKHSWAPWLLMRACRYDLVVMTGDVFASRVMAEEGLKNELLWLQVVTARLGKRTRLALGTGVGDEDIVYKLSESTLPDWRSYVPEVATTDGMNQVVAGQTGRILVSVFGSHLKLGEIGCFRFMQWRDAHKTAQTFKLPWIVVAPLGPLGSAITQWYNPHTGEYDWLGCSALGAEIEKYQPDFVIGGFPHHTPFEGGHWCEWIGKTLVLNPGCRPTGEFPCHIELDLERKRARWRVPGMEDSVVTLGQLGTENPQPST